MSDTFPAERFQLRAGALPGGHAGGRVMHSLKRHRPEKEEP